MNAYFIMNKGCKEEPRGIFIHASSTEYWAKWEDDTSAKFIFCIWLFLTNVLPDLKVLFYLRGL